MKINDPSTRIVKRSELRAKALKADAAGKAFCGSCYRSTMNHCGYFDECGWEDEMRDLIGGEPRCLQKEGEQ